MNTHGGSQIPFDRVQAFQFKVAKLDVHVIVTACLLNKPTSNRACSCSGRCCQVHDLLWNWALLLVYHISIGHSWWTKGKLAISFARNNLEVPRQGPPYEFHLNNIWSSQTFIGCLAITATLGFSNPSTDFCIFLVSELTACPDFDVFLPAPNLHNALARRSSHFWWSGRPWKICILTRVPCCSCARALDLHKERIGIRCRNDLSCEFHFCLLPSTNAQH